MATVSVYVRLVAAAASTHAGDHNSETALLLLQHTGMIDALHVVTAAIAMLTAVLRSRRPCCCLRHRCANSQLTQLRLQKQVAQQTAAAALSLSGFKPQGASSNFTLKSQPCSTAKCCLHALHVKPMLPHSMHATLHRQRNPAPRHQQSHLKSSSRKRSLNSLAVALGEIVTLLYSVLPDGSERRQEV